jgi:DNA-binding LacI/PurR family transcriptional regulator
VKNSNPVTTINVTREVGVSCATISRVLNNEGNVKPETRERVFTERRCLIRVND